MVSLRGASHVSYRRRERSGAGGVPFLLVSVALTVLVIGVLCVFAAVYVTSALGAIEAPAGGALFGDLLVEPFVMLFQGGVVTLAGGGVLTVSGGFLMIVSS